MKHFNITILLLFIIFISCNKQTINENPLLVGCISVDIDSTVFTNSVLLYGKLIIIKNDTLYNDSIEVDVDNNKTIDFKIGFQKTIDDSGTYQINNDGKIKYFASNTQRSWIKANNNFEILANKEYNYVYARYYGSSVGNYSLDWIKSSSSITIAAKGNGVIYENEMNQIDNSHTYIVFRKTDDDTRKYGWIQINPRCSYGIEIVGYAIQK